MLIRKWEAKDDFQIAQLERRCFAFPWSYEMVCETSRQENFFGVVSEKNGEIIGYAGAIFCLDQADIALVATNPDFRRQGIAEAVVNRLIEQLIQIGITTVYLEVRVTNVGARALYEKIGFKIVGIRKNYYEDAEDAIVMAKEI